MPRRDEEDDDFEARPRRRRRDDDDLDDRPRRRRKPAAGPPVKLILAILGGIGLVCVLGCLGLLWSGRKVRDAADQRQAAEDQSRGELTAARAGYRVTTATSGRPQKRPPTPPANLFQLVKYDAPKGQSSAYLTPDPGDGKKHPAVVWITGGDCNSIDDGCWQEGPAENDQSASAFRKAGVVMMFPSLRGGNGSPGLKEFYLGEVDDVVAAANWLAKQEYVDPARIYLGGHSTGGTLVLLTAQCSDRFRAVFSFGPVDDISGYPAEFKPVDNDAKAIQLRSPGRWLHCVKVPTFVFEGTVEGNLDSLKTMARQSTNPKAKFYPVRGADHFSLLAPLTKLLAARILTDAGPACTISLSEDEVNTAARRR